MKEDSEARLRKKARGRTSFARIGRMGEETKRIENPCDENSCAALPPLQDGDEAWINREL